MAGDEDQQDLQKYLDNLNKDVEDDDEEDEDGNLVLTITTEVDEDDDGDNDDECNNGTIIMDADGNYYFQTSDKTVEVKPLKKTTPVKKVAATVVTPSSKRKKPENQLAKTPKLSSSSSSTIKPPVKVEDVKTMKKEAEIIKITKIEAVCLKQEEVPPKKEPVPPKESIPSKESAASEIGENDEHIYEFDETEQDPDDPSNDKDKDEEYESKGVMKLIKTKSATTTQDVPFYCMLCPYETNKKFLLSRHLKTHSDDRPYKCSVCERGFKTNASLMNHVNTHLGKKPHACKDCEKTFTTSGELVRHVRYRHTHIKPHKCNECDYSSVEMSKLRRHMRCHTGERPYQCPHCTYASPDTFKLKRHLRTHTGEKPYECDICHARFTQSNSLKYHRLIHSVNDKPVFQCHLCPTTCGRKTDLRLHIKKLHSSDQPLPCKRCGKELPDRYSYKMHVKTHEGEKCYRCTYCTYASISERHLESHMLIHTDTKPFICEFCEMTFRQKQLLARHIKVYHTNNYAPPEPRKKDHKCPHCYKAFAFNGNLMRHMETHDPTSQISEERQKLRLGRLKRVQADGSVVTVIDYKNGHNPGSVGYVYEGEDNNGEDLYEEEYEEGELEEQQEDQEQQEQQLQYEEEYEEYNEGQIQYVYEDFEEQDEEPEEFSEIKPNMGIKIENSTINTAVPQPTPQLKRIAVKQESEGSELMELQVEDDQGFMVIEVLQEEEEDVSVDTKQDSKPTLRQVGHNVINKNVTNASVIKTPSVVNTSDCFGFEVDCDDDDEETKGAIQLLQIIEQE